MPAHSFGPEWINPLLRGDKRGTTRPQHTQVKVGDIVSIYNQQRRRIIDKPIMELTHAGYMMMEKRIKDNNYPLISSFDPLQYYVHFLGKVEILAVFDIHPCEMYLEDLEIWAWDDGFPSFRSANEWFTEKYGNEWINRWWTVERWAGWLERYFLADEGDVL